eukprot:g2100.t1
MSTFLPKPLKVKVHGEGCRKKKSGQVRFEDLDLSQGMDDTPWAQKQIVRLAPIKGTTHESAYVEVTVSCTVLAEANSDDEDDVDDEDRGSDTDNDEDDDGKGEEIGEMTLNKDLLDTKASAHGIEDRSEGGHEHAKTYRDRHNDKLDESGYGCSQVIENAGESGVLGTEAPARKSGGAQQSIAQRSYPMQQPVVSLSFVEHVDPSSTESAEQTRGQTLAQVAQPPQSSLREHITSARRQMHDTEVLDNVPAELAAYALALRAQLDLVVAQNTSLGSSFVSRAAQRALPRAPPRASEAHELMRQARIHAARAKDRERAMIAVLDAAQRLFEDAHHELPASIEACDPQVVRVVECALMKRTVLADHTKVHDAAFHSTQSIPGAGVADLHAALRAQAAEHEEDIQLRVQSALQRARAAQEESHARALEEAVAARDRYWQTRMEKEMEAFAEAQQAAASNRATQRDGAELASMDSVRKAGLALSNARALMKTWR